MLVDLSKLQPILEKRGPYIQDDERLQVLETLNDRYELSDEGIVKPTNNARRLLALSLKHLGHRAGSGDAEDVLQDYYAEKFRRLVAHYDPYPAELVLWARVLVTARKLGAAGEWIWAGAKAGVERGVPVTAELSLRPENHTTEVVAILAVDDNGQIVSTAGDVAQALALSPPVERFVRVREIGEGDGLPVSVLPLARLKRGGPPRPSGGEWKLFHGFFLMDLKRYCWRRSIRRRQPIFVSLSDSGSPDDAADPDLPSPAPSPEEEVSQREIRENFRACLESLDRLAAAALIGHHVLGLALLDLVGLVLPKVPSKDDEASQETAVSSLLRGVPPLRPPLDAEEMKRRENCLRQTLRRARERLQRCLLARRVVKGVLGR